MPALKKPSDILNYVTPAELESLYVRCYQGAGYPLAAAIDAARERVRRIKNAT